MGYQFVAYASSISLTNYTETIIYNGIVYAPLVTQIPLQLAARLRLIVLCCAAQQQRRELANGEK